MSRGCSLMRQWFCKLHWVTRLQAPNPFDLFQGTSSLRSTKFLTVMAKRCLCPVTMSHSAPQPLTGNRLHRGLSTTLYLPTLRQEGPTFSELPSAMWMTTHGGRALRSDLWWLRLFLFLFSVLPVLGKKPMASQPPGKYSTTEIYPQTL